MISTTWFRKSPHVLTPTDPRKFLVIMGIICCSLVLLASDLSAQVAEITSKKLSFLKPSGREIFKPGDTVIVMWGGTPDWRDDTVQIELSGDNGVSWQTIADIRVQQRPPLAKSDTTYRWIVPSVACKECLLRVHQTKGFLGAGDTADRFDIPAIPLEKDERMEAIFSDKDSLLAIRTDDTISIWNIVTKELFRTIPMPQTTSKLYFQHIRFASNDSLMIVGTGGRLGEDTTYVFIWNIYSGDLLYQFPVRVVLSIDYMYARGGAVSPDGEKVIVAGMFMPYLRGLPEENVLGRLDAGYSYSADFSPDGRKIVVGGTHYLTCWDAATLEQLYLIDGEAFFVQFSGDGKYIVSHVYRPRYEDNQSLRILDAQTGDTVFKVRLGSEDSPLARFAKASQRFIVDGKVYDLGQRFRYYWPMASPKNDTIVRSFALTPSGSLVADVSETGTVVLMDVTKDPVATMTVPFSITGTLPIAGNRYLGAIEVGKARDTVINGFLVNGANTPVNVTGVTIISGHTGDFAITSGAGPYTIAAGSSVPLGLHFVPSDTGRRAVIIEVQTEFGPVRAEIWGDGFKKTGGVEEEQHTSRSSSGLALSVRPNPATDQVTVRYTAIKSEGLNLVLFDMAGRQIDRINLGRVEPGSYEFQYDVGSLLTGVYRLELRSEREGVGQRAVVVH